MKPFIVKEEIRKLISDAKISADKITKDAVRNCDTHQLSFLIGDVDEARGATATLVKLFPEDNEIKEFWKDITSYHILAYKGRDRFVAECECKKRQS